MDVSKLDYKQVQGGVCRQDALPTLVSLANTIDSGREIGVPDRGFDCIRNARQRDTRSTIVCLCPTAWIYWVRDAALCLFSWPGGYWPWLAKRRIPLGDLSNGNILLSLRVFWRQQG